MTKYAVVKIGGSQFKVSEGDVIKVDKIDEKKDKSLVFDQVLLLVDGEKVSIGEPYLKNVKIKGTVVDQIKGEKIRVATYKAKSRYRKVKGFRAKLTMIKIDKFSSATSKKVIKPGD